MLPTPRPTRVSRRRALIDSGRGGRRRACAARRRSCWSGRVIRRLTATVCAP